MALSSTLLIVGALLSRRTKRTQMMVAERFRKGGYTNQYSKMEAKEDEKWWVPEKHTIPVYDFNGEMVGHDSLQFRRLNKHTANYVVHQVYTCWEYQMKEFNDFFPRRKDAGGGKKLWANKGVGKARMKSVWGTLFGKTSSRRPHGYDTKRDKYLPPALHHRAISTVLQSKWKRIRVVDNLESWGEAKYYKFRSMMENVTGVEAGLVDTLVIARNAKGNVNRHRHTIDQHSYKSPIWMAGHLIPRTYFRTPEHIDPGRDGLKRLLQARRVIISREALHDLMRKYGAQDGWVWRRVKDIYMEQCAKLAEEYPFDREAEFEAARILPASGSQREFWARQMREEKAAEALA